MDFSYEPIRRERILAIDPRSPGFGFVVIEAGPLQLIDWGGVTMRKGKSARSNLTMRTLLKRYQPTVVVLEDVRQTRRLRRAALIKFMDATSETLSQCGVPVRTYSRQEIRRVFEPSGQFTKQGIATVLVAQFPELHPHLPRPRKVWESEDSRMSIFDALSLAIAHLMRAREKTTT